MSEDNPTNSESPNSDQSLKDRLANDMKWGEWVIDIAIRAKFRCEYCDRDLLSSVDAYKEWQHDHIVPQRVKQDEKDHPNNMALSCRTCNVNFKGKWDPSHNRSKDASRYELIRAVRDYVAKKRANAFSEVLKVREIVYGV